MYPDTESIKALCAGGPYYLLMILHNIVVRFPDSYAVKGEMLREFWFYLFEDVSGNIFSCWIVFRKEGEIVQHLMVQFGDHFDCQVLEFPEINTQTGVIHYRRCDMNLNPVIMAMLLRAIAL